MKSRGISAGNEEITEIMTFFYISLLTNDTTYNLDV